MVLVLMDMLVLFLGMCLMEFSVVVQEIKKRMRDFAIKKRPKLQAARYESLI